MILGLNLLYLLPGFVGGTETYAAGLLDGFASLDVDARFLVYCNRESRDWPLPDDPRFSRVVCPVGATTRAARIWYEQRRLPDRVRADGAGLLHSLGYVAPLRLPCPSVVTVHDVHHLAYGSVRSLPRRLILGWLVARSVRRASAVIAVSRFTRLAVARTYGVDEAKIEVVLEAPKPSRAPASSPRHATQGPYLIAFASVAPNKNIPRLLEAFAIARRRYGLAHRLVLVGRLPDAVRADADGVTATGYVEDAALDALLRGADALVFPSLYEGFGLPILEAMAAGVPVVCSDAAAIPEIAGEAARYFPPTDVERMAASIAETASDETLRARLRAQGFARAAAFSWERAARETMGVYRRVLT